jgi:hypothetical protein
MALLHAIFGFILAGITLEVFWTSILDFIKSKNPRLTGVTYLWMFPIYALVPFIYIFVLWQFQNANIFLKGIIYMLGFYVLEFISGYLIKKAVGKSPWNYNRTIKIFGKRYKTHLDGLICLEYAPIWYLYGIFGEYYFKYLIGL